jgi:hypothetical protein
VVLEAQEPEPAPKPTLSEATHQTAAAPPPTPQGTRWGFRVAAAAVAAVCCLLLLLACLSGDAARGIDPAPLILLLLLIGGIVAVALAVNGFSKRCPFCRRWSARRFLDRRFVRECYAYKAVTRYDPIALWSSDGRGRSVSTYGGASRTEQVLVLRRVYRDHYEGRPPVGESPLGDEGVDVGQELVYGLVADPGLPDVAHGRPSSCCSTGGRTPGDDGIVTVLG